MSKIEEAIEFVSGFSEEITVNLFEDNKYLLGAFDIKRDKFIEKLRSYGDMLQVDGVGSREFYIEIGNSKTTVAVSDFEFDDVNRLPLGA